LLLTYSNAFISFRLHRLQQSAVRQQADLKCINVAKTILDVTVNDQLGQT